MPIRPDASFPGSVWDGYTTGNPDRNDDLDQVDPDWQDFERLAVEIAAVQNYTLNVLGGATTTVSSGQELAAGTYLVDATSGDITVTLPAASEADGVLIRIKKKDSSANAVIIDADASETIDGETTQVLNIQYASLSIVCDGTEWFIV